MSKYETNATLRVTKYSGGPCVFDDNFVNFDVISSQKKQTTLKFAANFNVLFFDVISVFMQRKQQQNKR